MISQMVSQKSSQFSKNSEYQDSDLSSDDENSVDSVRNKLKLLRENQFKKPIDICTSMKNNSVSSKFTVPIDQNKKIMTDLFGEDDDDALFLKSIQENTKTESTSFISTPVNKNTESTLIVTPPSIQTNRETEILNKSQQIISQIDSRTSSYSANKSLNSSEIEAANRSKCLQLLDGNICWQRSQENLKNIFQGTNLNQKSILDYNTKLYYKRCFQKDMAIKVETINDGFRKLPFLCASIKEITRKPDVARLILNDGCHQLLGTLSNKILHENIDILRIGTVLLIQNINLTKVNFRLDCYHLIIMPENLLSIFYESREGIESEGIEVGDDGIIKRKDLIAWDCLKIKQLIDRYEEEFVNLEYIATHKENSMNKSSNKSTSTKKSSSLTNLHKKPAPYHVPARPQPPQSNQQQKQNNVPQQPQAINKKPLQTQVPSQRNFQFKSSSNITSSSISQSRVLNLPSTQSSSHSSQRNIALSQAELGNLLAGIEDEFLDDQSSKRKIALSQAEMGSLLAGIEDEFLDNNSSQRTIALSQAELGSLLGGIEDEFLED